MAQWNALTIQSGVTRQLHQPDELIVGSGIDADTGGTGTLTLGSTNASSIVLAKNTSMSGATTFSTGTGAVTLAGPTTVSGSNTFTTGTGTVTVNGATVFAGVAVTASGAASFDLSGGSGAFKTSGGAVTIGPGAVTVSGTTTFTASGVALVVNNSATVTGTLTAGGVLTSSVDTAAAGPLNIGTTTATGVNLGSVSSTVFVQNALQVENGLTVDTGGATVSAGNLIVTTGNLSVLAGDGYFGTTITLNGLSTGIAHVSSSGVLSSSAVNLASADVTGILPTANQAAQTMGGDVTGTTAAAVVVALQGNAVESGTNGASQDGYVLTWVNGSSEYQVLPPASTTTVVLAGDVTGVSNANTVVKINGTSVPATPTAAQVLIAQTGTAAAWETFSQDATITTAGVVTVNGSHAATFAATGAITAGTTITAGTGLTVTSGGLTVTAGGASITGGTVTDTLNTTGLATLNSASVTTTLGVTGISTLTGGVKTPSVDSISGALSLGATASTVTLGKVGALTEVLGNFQVDGTETVIGTSIFQSPVTFDGNVTVPDGYTVFTDSISSGGAVGGTGLMTINGIAGIDLQRNGVTYLDVGATSSGNIFVPSGVVLQASGTGQIIATSSAGVSDITASGVDTSGVAAINYAVYVSANATVLAADSSAIATSYCIGFNKDTTGSGNIYTDGVVTPVFSTGITPTFGQVMYVDTGANAGKLTNVSPATGVIAPVGFMLDATRMVIRVLTPAIL